jgi:tetratricopeptide (TPR) repeat protein
VKQKNPPHDISVRKLQSLLGVSRSVLAGLIEAGFVTPARGPRNELRFTFQDVVLLRTAFQLQSARISSRKILAALARLRTQLPDEIPLSGIRVSAVGNTIMVRTGPSQWDANTGQLAFDFEVADIKGDVVFLDASSAKKDARKQADEWYALADQMAADADSAGAEQAYRKAIAISPKPFYSAYVDLGAFLCEDDARCQDALAVFDEALTHFPEDAVLHFNRAVALELLGRLADAEQSYARCLEINPRYADAHHNLALVKEQLGDKQGLVRHMSAYRKLST